jgi:hypothetical protein
MYVNQLQIGENYARLTPSISTCLLEKPVFGGVDQAHLRFQMVNIVRE